MVEVLLSSGLTTATGRDGLTGGRPPLALAVTVTVLFWTSVTVTYEMLHELSPCTTVSLVGTGVI